MKKSFYLISLAAMVIAGCAKEAPETQEQTITPNNKVVALYATMPEFIDAQTKAGVNDSGDFTWNESDPISVIYTNGTDEKEIIFLCVDASEGRFEPVDPTEIEVGYTLKTEGTVAYYPTGYDGTPSNCDYAMEIDEAKANFQMHATNDNGTLKFVHDNALLKVTVSNVPAFAKTLTVGGVSVNLNLTEAGDVTAYIPIAPAASAKMSISVTDDANNSIISKNSQNSVAIEAANLYNLPNLTIPVSVYVSKYSGWSKMYAYVYYKDGENYPHETAWPGEEITSNLQAITVSSSNVGLEAHVILNAGDQNLAKPFTRIETEAFTASSSKKITVNSVAQENMILYFRDDKGQSDNFEYYIYGWYDDNTKIFGNWPGWSKNASSFSWSEYAYGQSNNWIASYTFTGKPKINIILNNNGSNQTADIALEGGKENWFVVSNNCASYQTESFPTVSVSVE